MCWIQFGSVVNQIIILQTWVILTPISGEIVNGLSEGTEGPGRCSTAPASLGLEDDNGGIRWTMRIGGI
jgi:hypothetical protein